MRDVNVDTNNILGILDMLSLLTLENEMLPTKKSWQQVAYFHIVFFNAFIDLGHKILIQSIFFKTLMPTQYAIMSAVVNSLILLPHLALFSPSGFISDRFAKAKVIRYTAWAAVPLTLFITAFYYMGWFWAAFAMTFLLGAQSAINSPSKYGYVKEFFGKEKIAQANGYVQAITMIAILAGSFLFSVFFDKLTVGSANTIPALLHTIAPLGFLLIAGSFAESFFTMGIQQFAASAPQSRYNFTKYLKMGYAKSYLKEASSNKLIFTCIIGLSLFWGVNQVIVAEYGAYLKAFIPGATTSFAQGIMGLSIIGIFLGATYAGRISKNFIETGTIPAAIFGITVLLWAMFHATSKPLIGCIFVTYGFFCGMLIVPLNSLIQFNAPNSKLGRILATNNFLQNIFMLAFLGTSVILLILLKIPVVMLFYGLFSVAVVSFIYSLWLLPQSLIRYILFAFVSRFYKLDVIGLNNMPSSGGILLLGNHTSYLDWAIIQVASPRPVRFVMEKDIYNKWYLNWLLRHFKIIPISTKASKQSIKNIEDALNQGDIVALFPEGHISRNGQIGSFLRGFEKSVQNTKAKIIPFYLRGLWGSKTSYADRNYKKLSKNRIRNVSITFGSTLTASTPAAAVKKAVINLSRVSWQNYANQFTTIPRTWLKRAKKVGKKTSIIDTNGTHLDGYKTITGVLTLRKIIKKHVNDQERIGILLPPSAAGVLTTLASLCLGKCVVNLNYTASKESFQHAIKKAGITTVFSANLFIKKLELRGIPIKEWLADTNTLYLDEIKKQSKRGRTIHYYLLSRFLPASLLRLLFIKNTKPDATAAILFSSGSEGLPKGIELSHKNIIANVKQISCITNLQSDDTILNCLPLFHAFGITVTTMMPLLEGQVMVCHSDPTDCANIAKTVKRYKVTLLCSTSSFLNLYSRHPKVHQLMFKSLRLVIAGAEKLSDSVREQFKAKFGLDIYEGYGATETAPVATVNIPDILIETGWHVHVTQKQGTVGLPIPGTSIKIIDPDSKKESPTDEPGMIMISGPQIMKGYLDDPEKTKQTLVTMNDQTWYITGDKGFIDSDGFLSIVDRYSRFAKIAGEMVSLSSAEKTIQQAVPDISDCVTVNIPDPKKGEAIVLLAISELTSNDIITQLRKSKINSLLMPSYVFCVAETPKLGSGKTDFYQSKLLALSLLEGE